MKTLSDAIIETILSTTTSKDVLGLLESINADILWKKELYFRAHQKPEIETIEVLLKEHYIQFEFKFISAYFQQCLDEKKYHHLALPYFQHQNLSFKEAVKSLTEDRFSSGLLRIFGEKLEAYGVTFLNNYYELKTLQDSLGISHDQVLALDHSHVIPKGLADAINGIDCLLRNYSHKRKMILLCSNPISHVEDIKRMWSTHSLNQDPELKYLLPRKPKSLKEIHDELVEKLRRRTNPKLKLNQELSAYDNSKIDEFILEVPKSTHDLIDTSNDLRHCVFSYGSDVIQKNCQILNLLKDGKRIYTIEIQGKKGSYRIIQFKGLLNDSRMEGGLGITIRAKVLELINAKE